MQSLSFPLLLAIVAAALFGIVTARAKSGNRQQQMVQKTYTNVGSLDQCLKQIEPKVCDLHGVFSEEERTRLDEQLARVQESTKREGYPLSNTTKKCGMQGITMPIIMLKAEMTNIADVQKQLNDVNKEYTDAHPCMRIAFIMLNAADKVDQRRFWSGVNWNVNVKPSEIVSLYRKEIPNVLKAKYADALYGIVREFTAMATQRLNTPFPEAPMTRTNVGTSGNGQQVTYTAQSDQSEDTPAEGGDKKNEKDDEGTRGTAKEDTVDETNKARQHKKTNKGGDNKKEENTEQTSE